MDSITNSRETRTEHQTTFGGELFHKIMDHESSLWKRLTTSSASFGDYAEAAAQASLIPLASKIASELREAQVLAKISSELESPYVLENVFVKQRRIRIMTDESGSLASSLDASESFGREVSDESSHLLGPSGRFTSIDSLSTKAAARTSKLTGELFSTQGANEAYSASLDGSGNYYANQLTVRRPKFSIKLTGSFSYMDDRSQSDKYSSFLKNFPVGQVQF